MIKLKDTKKNPLFLMCGKTSLNKTLNQTLELEAAKEAIGLLARLMKVKPESLAYVVTSN
jgi:hypothetical protein